jgi:hypothetical protein
MVFMVLLGHSASVLAALVPEHPMLADRYFFSLGAFYPESNTQGSVNSGTVGIGSFIDFESDMGLDERKLVGQIMFRMRLSERWRLEAEYAKVDRDHEKSVSRSIDFGDLSIPVSASVETSFSFEDARVAVGYSFFRTKDKEVGIGLGIHAAKMETSLDTQNFGSQSASTSGPLPTVSIYSQVALTDRWLLNVRLDRLSLDSGDVSGSVSSTGIEFVFQPWRHVNIGLGFRETSMDLSSTGDDWRGQVQVQQHGPLVFIGTTF